MTQIVVAMVVIVLLAGVVVVYVAFPHRGEDLPGVPWLGRLMRKGAQSLPTVDPEPGELEQGEGAPYGRRHHLDGLGPMLPGQPQD